MKKQGIKSIICTVISEKMTWVSIFVCDEETLCAHFSQKKERLKNRAFFKESFLKKDVLYSLFYPVRDKFWFFRNKVEMA